MLEEVFLRDICNNPDDDAVRLIYADWLLEQDDPERRDRGELIHVQCQLARWEGEFRSWAEWAELAPRVPALRKRERQLLAQYGRTWSQPLHELATKCVFRRGFVEAVHLPTDTLAGPAFAQRSEDLLRLAPVQHFFLPHVPVGLEALKPSIYLSRLRGLTLSGYIPPERALVLLNAPALSGLTTLVFNRGHFSGVFMAALASQPGLARLESLALQGCHVNGSQLQTLAESPHWNPDCRLDLRGIRMTPLLPPDAIQNRFNPQMLRMALAVLRPPGQRSSNGAIRALLDQLACQPAQVAPLLNRALVSSSSELRAAASTFVACLREQAMACLPALIQRINDGDRRVRGSAAAALADLIPCLPPEVQRDLCRFADPLFEPRNRLEALLGREDLVPVLARRALVARCERRLAAHARRSGLGAPPLCSAFASAAEFSHRVIVTMEEHAAATGKPQNAIRTRQQECAWMLARVFEILHPREAL